MSEFGTHLRLQRDPPGPQLSRNRRPAKGGSRASAKKLALGKPLRLADMNIDVLVMDDRRIEVVANGSFWHGSQQAVGATIVCPVTRAGEAQPGADTHPGQALVGATRRKRRQT